jgi:hypothetical protein
MNRRTVLKTSVFGGLLLGTAGLAAVYLGRKSIEDRHTVFRALIPAVLDGVPELDEAKQVGLEKALTAVDIAIGGLPLDTQQEIDQLMTLLSAAPTRLALTGTSKPWPERSVVEVTETLNGWRTHRLPLMQAAYHAIHDLILGAWYGDETHWNALQYTGPQAFNT